MIHLLDLSPMYGGAVEQLTIVHTTRLLVPGAVLPAIGPGQAESTRLVLLLTLSLFLGFELLELLAGDQVATDKQQIVLFGVCVEVLTYWALPYLSKNLIVYF